MTVFDHAHPWTHLQFRERRNAHVRTSSATRATPLDAVRTWFRVSPWSPRIAVVTLIATVLAAAVLAVRMDAEGGVFERGRRGVLRRTSDAGSARCRV